MGRPTTVMAEALLSVDKNTALARERLTCLDNFLHPRQKNPLQPLLKGLIIALVGGLGSITGAVIAAFFIGLIEALTASYLGGQYVLIGQILFIIIVLLIRPRGVSGMLDEFRE